MFEKHHHQVRHSKSWRIYKKKQTGLRPAVQQLFEKKFHYQVLSEADAPWLLLASERLFGEVYHLEQLQQLKQALNQTKIKLNDYELVDWSSHTQRMEPSSAIPWHLKNNVKAEFVTIAWCKFFECLHRYPLVKGPRLNSLHLCEAPGAFIAALNHYLYSTYTKEEVNWKWLSTTLNPYNEGNPLSKMITDDRFIWNTLDHWLFHNDYTGNIISRHNIEEMMAACATRLEDDVHLITADGSIDCVEHPDCQEDTVASLHGAEIIAALSILADGGCFVIKMFTLFEATSVCNMYLLNCVFESVHVFKPASSKRGNSEVYVICLGYKKATPQLSTTLDLMKTKMLQGQTVLPLFAKAQLPKDFLLQHEICARLFMQLQIAAIESNIYTYEARSPQAAHRAHLLRIEVWSHFEHLYRVQHIPEELAILYACQGIIGTNRPVNMYKGSYSDREVFKHTSMEQKLFALRRNLNDLEKTLDATCFVVPYSEQQTRRPQQDVAVAALQLYRGSPIAKVHSSLFTAVNLLLMRNQVEGVFHLDAAWLGKPRCCIYDANGSRELTFEYNSNADFGVQESAYFVRLLEACVSSDVQCIVFQYFPFLTHYSVSLLRYLSLHIFPQININPLPAFEITVSREGVNEWSKGKDLLSHLLDLLQQDGNILCLMNLSLLHGTAFSQALSDYNNQLLLQNLRHLLNT